MRNSLIAILLVLLFSSIASAEYYLRYDLNTGAITGAYPSIDAKVVGIYDDPDILYVTPEVFKVVATDFEHYLIKDKKVTVMTTQEKEDYDAAKKAAQDAAAAAAAKIPTLEKLLAVLVTKGIITLKDVQYAEPIKTE